MVDLKQYLKKDIRFQMGELILREPNEIEKDEIKSMLLDKLKLDESGKVSGEFNLRYIYRELTSIGNGIDELSDEKFNELINDKGNKYNRSIKLLNDAVIELVQEISEDIMLEQVAQVNQISSMLNILNNTQDINKMYEKLAKFFKKNKIDITAEELMKTNGDVSKIMELKANAKPIVKKNKKGNK